MSDEEQGSIPEDQPQNETPETDGVPSEASPEGAAQPAEPAESTEPNADAAGSADAGEAGESAVPPEMSADAADALAAAQAAVAEAMAGDLTGSSDETEAVDNAAASVDAANDDIAAMMAQAMLEEGIDPEVAAANAAKFNMPSFAPAGPKSDSAEMQLLGDVNVDVRIELGRTRMLVEDVLRLGEGAVVELEKLAGDPVDVFVNGRHVARGEVLVLNESFCVRVNEVVEPVSVASPGDG